MATQASQSIKLFYCYAREDHVLRDKLDEHLTTLHRIGLITTWYDGEIVPGASWEEEIEINLDTADIILLLISPAFIRSDYCYSKEMERALERHRAREARVVPIILRPVDWAGTPFSALQMLPSSARPVTLWPDSDEAFKDVAQGIRRVVNGLLKQRHPGDTQPPYTSLKEAGTMKDTTPSTQRIPSLTSFSTVSQHISRRKFFSLLIIIICLLLLGGSTRLFYFSYYLPNQQHAKATATALTGSTRTAGAVATATAAIVNATAALATGQNPYPPTEAPYCLMIHCARIPRIPSGMKELPQMLVPARLEEELTIPQYYKPISSGTALIIRAHSVILPSRYKWQSSKVTRAASPSA